MKKNVMLKIASVLMIAVLLTTCAISSTFAKYVTVGEASSSQARVAKWGVEVTTDITGLFLDKYDTTAGNEVFKAEGTFLVAPGTTNYVDLNSSVSGTPEVSVKVMTDAEITLTGWTIDSGVYCPLVFVIDDQAYAINDDESLTAYADRIEGIIETKATKEFKANTDLAGATAADVKIEWKWDYEDSTAVDSEGNPLIQSEKDIKDTKLAAIDSLVKVEIKQTVVQTDTYTGA